MALADLFLKQRQEDLDARKKNPGMSADAKAGVDIFAKKKQNPGEVAASDVLPADALPPPPTATKVTKHLKSALTKVAPPEITKEIAQQVKAENPEASKDSVWDSVGKILVQVAPTLIGGAIMGAEGAKIGADVTLGQMDKDKAEAKDKEQAKAKATSELNKQNFELSLKEAGENRADERERLKRQNELEMKRMEFGNAKKQFEQLPMENQVAIKELAQKNSSILNAASQLRSVVEQLSDESIPKEQRLAVAKGSLKMINSLQGSDAIGVEEGKRLGAFLESNLIPNLVSGETFRLGADLLSFRDQIGNVLNTAQNAAATNHSHIQAFSSGQPIQLQQFVPGQRGQGGPSGNAFAGMSPQDKREMAKKKLMMSLPSGAKSLGNQ